MSLRPSRALAFASLVTAIAACSNGVSTTGKTGGATSAASATMSSAATTSSATTNATASGTGGGSCVPDTNYMPTPTDIEFQAMTPLPTGDQILFNDWNSMPNSLWSMQPDGSSVTEIFRVFRLWSFGASNAGDKIAFSCGDPQQQAHFCVDIGDAIQNSFLYDAATENVTLLANGNINDECQTFGPGDKTLYLCRRYDFMEDGSNKGYRIGAITLADHSFNFITADNPGAYDLNPAPTVDGLGMLYTEIPVPTGTRALLDRTFATSMDKSVRTNVDEPSISPDGTKYAYVDYGSQGSLHASNLDGTNDVVVSSEKATNPKWSPDGSTVAYLVYDNTANCSHVDVAKADGSEAAMPKRIYDCSTNGRFITNIAYIHRN